MHWCHFCDRINKAQRTIHQINKKKNKTINHYLQLPTATLTLVLFAINPPKVI